MGRNIVNLIGLQKEYIKYMRVLDGLSLDIREGEVFGYIGPNGAGKTTTIRIIMGLINDYEGEVIIDGMSMRDDRLELTREIGYLPQRSTFQPWRTVEHTLRTFGQLSGMDEDTIEENMGQLLGLLGIEEYRDRKMVHLSGGTLQKVGLAQALLHEPKLLVLDEPFSGLDPESRVLFKKVIRHLRANGTTVFFSSHILSDIEDIADRIGILGRGKMAYEGTIDEFRAQEAQTDTICVELLAPSPKVEELPVVPFVESVHRISERRFELKVRRFKSVDATIGNVIRFLIGNGIAIRSIYPKEESLEELYMRFVGGT